MQKAMTKVSRREHIIETTLRCIEKFGVNKTTLDDVAAEAGMGRMTLYRVFRTRNDLLNAAALSRLKLIGEGVAPLIRSYNRFEDAIIMGSLESIALAKSDPYYLQIVEALDDLSREKLLLSTDTLVQKFFADSWGNTFQKAREKGLLKDDISDNEIFIWLRANQLILFLREDLDRDGQIQFFKKFVMPPIMA